MNICQVLKKNSTLIIEVIFRVIILVIVKALVFYVAALNSCLHTAVATEAFAISARPVYGVLIPVVYPILIVLEYKNHTPSSMRWQIVNT